jgi:hypothetical protein
MRSPCCLYVCESPLINFRMAEPIFMKLGMYIMANESISTAYFINPSHQSVCLYVYTHIVARQQIGKKVTATKNTHTVIQELLERRFLCCPCLVKQNQAISSSQNLLF